MAVSDRAWSDITQADYDTADQWCEACLIDQNEAGDGKVKSACSLPVYEPNGDLNRNAVHAAAARIDQVDAPQEAIDAAKRELVRLYGELDEEPPESLKGTAVNRERATKSYPVGSLDWVRDEIARQTGDMWPEILYLDSAIIVDYRTGRAWKYPWTLADGDEPRVELGDRVEVENVWVEKAAALTGPIVAKNAAKRIAYAAVLVPDEEDADGEQVTKEQIEAAAHEWMEHYRQVDLQHSLNSVDAVPVESYITREDMRVTIKDQDLVLPQGTWVLATKHRNEQVWSDIESGKLAGYSMMGVRRAALKEAVGAVKEAGTATGVAAVKRTLLKDLGDDWVAPFVSVVDEPAVPKAKWFALKSATEAYAEPRQSWFDRIFGRTERDKPATGGNLPAEKVGRTISKANLDRLKSALEVLNGLIEQAEAERMDDSEKAAVKAIAEAVKEAVAPLADRLKDVEEAVKQKPPEEPPQPPKEDEAKTAEATKTDEGDAEGEPASEGDSEQVAALKNEVAGFKDELTKALEALEKRLPKATSKAIAGQDGDETSDEPKLLDEYYIDGRRKREKAGR